jgi:methionyl-tRNA formyltransferase|tara:strand:- start:64 stop:981 length:918 start_codon:yes stop_codon:yes gene_type:complete
MKIIILGNQKFGASVLQKFCEETDHKVVAVLCEPDIIGKPINPIKQYAESYKIPLFQPQNYKDKKLLDEIRLLKPDVCVMAYVNSFIPKEFRDIQKKATICFHPSLLPLHRGPSAINWPIILGSKETGLTIFYPNDRLDEGDIILQNKVHIDPNDTLGDVYFSKIFPLGVKACLKVVDLISYGNPPRAIQDKSKATYETWCKKSDSKINWNKSGQEIYNLIRGCNPQPGAWANFKENEYVFYDTCFEGNETLKYFPGQIISINKNEIVIAVNRGVLKISRMKSKQGKLYVKDMDTNIFKIGDTFI